MSSDTFDATFAPGAYSPSLAGVVRAGMPAMAPDEVEIAGIEFLSRVVSPISVRATVGNGVIRYRVVDAFGSRFTVAKASSERPLTLAELIDLIDHTMHEFGVGLTDVFRDLYSDPSNPTERAASFVRVSSAYYPQLEEYFAERSRSWLRDARGEPNGAKWLAAAVAAMHERVERRTAPPLHPLDVPDYRRIDELSELERVRIGRWLRTVTGYPGASVTWSTTTAEMRSSRRILDTCFSVRFGPGPDDSLEITRPFSSTVRYPSVHSFFSSLAAGVEGTPPATPCGEALGVAMSQLVSDDIWASGDGAGARTQVERVLGSFKELSFVPLEVATWAADFFFATGDSERARQLWTDAPGASCPVGRTVASLRARAVLAAAVGDTAAGLGLLEEAARISAESP